MGNVRVWAYQIRWLRHCSAALLLSSTAVATPLDAERADALRIQQHLASVEQRLRSAPVAALTAEARAKRARLLDELHDYWRAGVFPRNSGHVGERRPYFIDDEGRPCAVGALIQRSGYEALAARIDRQFHTDYVPDMSDKELLAWAKSSGFSVEELALIQPSYCNCDGWNGGFGPGDAAGGAGGAGGAPDGADYFQPVCASNGLTYWNECIAELCGGVTIVAQGACDAEPPCELCGTGARDVVVAECSGELTGICNGIDSQPGVVPVSDEVAQRWRELQQSECKDPSYDLPGGWQPAWRFDEDWQCESEPSTGGAGGTSGVAGAGGSSDDRPAAGRDPGGNAGTSSTDAEEESDGCSCRTVGSSGGSTTSLALLLAGAAALLRRRPRRQ